MKRDPTDELIIKQQANRIQLLEMRLAELYRDLHRLYRKPEYHVIREHDDGMIEILIVEKVESNWDGTSIEVFIR